MRKFALIFLDVKGIVLDSAYNLRSLEAPKLAIPAESGTFQDSAARLFNVLPDKLRHETDYDKFVKFVKNFLRQRAYD